jgi:putative hemolysin
MALCDTRCCSCPRVSCVLGHAKRRRSASLACSSVCQLLVRHAHADFASLEHWRPRSRSASSPESRPHDTPTICPQAACPARWLPRSAAAYVRSRVDRGASPRRHPNSQQLADPHITAESWRRRESSRQARAPFHLRSTQPCERVKAARWWRGRGEAGTTAAMRTYCAVERGTAAFERERDRAYYPWCALPPGWCVAFSLRQTLWPPYRCSS